METLFAIIEWAMEHGRATAIWLLRRRIHLSIVLAAIALLNTAAMGSFVIATLFKSREILTEPLSETFEATPQAAKALESVVLSGKELSGQGDFDTAPLDPAFENAMNPIIEALSQQPDTHPIKLLVRSKTANSFRPDEMYLTNDSADFFLYIPGVAVPDSSALRGRQESIQLTPATQPGLYAEVSAATNLSESLCAMTQIRVLPSEELSVPVQAYLVTGRGMLAICRSNLNDHREYFRHEFEPDRRFNERPYYKATIEGYRKQHLPYHRTHPYIDVAGSGIVRTICRAIQSPAISESILCVDIPLSPPDQFAASVQGKVDVLGGASVIVNCEINGVQVSCASDSKSERLQWIDRWWPFGHSDHASTHKPRLDLKLLRANHDHKLTDVLGQIRLYSAPHPGDDLKADDVSTGPLVFSVPVSDQFVDSNPNHRKAQVVLGVLDTQRVSDLLRLEIKGTGEAALILLASVVFLVSSVAFRANESRHCLIALNQILESSPSPCAILSSKGVVLKTNGTFAQLFGIKPQDAARFDLLIADSTRREAFTKRLKDVSCETQPERFDLQLRTSSPSMQRLFAVHASGYSDRPLIADDDLQIFILVEELRPQIVNKTPQGGDDATPLPEVGAS